ncbi:TonB-linked SusC/RagA family outer membrane protein [Dyadobacter sp. BE34]|uniref:TonB-linked SusC/RagA family outer membrane protein n=1 Tax=Dyadobacter fermentans TaxID=94254 RepID=A0ABU1QS01_9BACT|nr:MULTISPECIES: SusC/RagA family TonB-linked outer membrane protein [Dyadobacter]MDR6803944.1 TonB-linked SusC/RagA family outer membrane protein [Dyadobacter fermentans]MDR7041684.1 TonB-linked SusC/RagA family outer membrane protein [Dyadobacter sp. BE242]MDR7196087.1 TonB-linked SusC/RagA family outer membrane protein [Dyadobacter sp. BE34]MDR7213368.1 TonB-linked SusC/RagA family outer membrane protein [Dyadobacter sp. BE31]MDR7261493.1 TonB-linked SusC/RagA family outer membrane protein 
MMKKLLHNNAMLLCLTMAFCWNAARAQNGPVTGKVTDKDGVEIPGVSVSVKGTSQGTSTNEKGTYSVQAGPGAVLVFSFIGFKKQEVVLGNQRSNVNVQMEADVSMLDEVVVTALGQTQEKRAIGYSVQSIRSDEIKESGNPNMVGALQGKIAGAVITGSGGAPGAGVNIILRGITSLSGSADNQPLFVIDGIIISNATTAGNPLPSAGSASPGASEQFANTNRAADINPDDVESVSVLKGPAATALYGLRASNGAIIITTRRGKSGKLNVSLSLSGGVDVLGKSPDIQTRFLQGRFGEFISPTEVRQRTPYQSFGPSVIGNTTDRIYDNFRGFYQTGFRTNNNITLTKGSEKGNIYVSAGHNYQQGIVPATYFERTSAKIAGTYNFTKRFSASGSFNYIRSGGKRPPAGDKSVFSALSYWPNTYDVNDYLNPDGSYKNLLPGFTDNPVYLVKKSPRIDAVNRYIADVTLNYNITDWLSAKYQITMDAFNERRKRQVDSTFDVGTAVKGFLIEENINYREINSNLYLTATKQFSENWNGSLMVGNSVVGSKRPDSYYERGEGWKAPFTDEISSYRNQQKRFYSPLQYRIVSFFADAKLSYKDMLYLNATGRNDIVSTLPKANNSFFYPSFSAGYIFTENLPKNNILSYGKLRASWAQVGKGTDPYVIGVYYELADNFPFGNTVPGYVRRSTTAADNLKPERTTSIEFGTELRFFRNRLMLDATYFTMDSKDQIVRAPVSNVSGYSFYYTNIGLIRNKGIELLATFKPVQTARFNWDMSLNFTKMSGKVIEMPEELEEISYFDNGSRGVLKVREGSKLGELWGLDYLRAPDGQLLIQPNGFPLTSQVTVPWGNALPDWTAGLTNSFNYRGIGLSFLLEWRQGGDVVDLGERNAFRAGSIEITGRRYERVVFKGVVEQKGADNSVTYVPNTKSVVLDDAFYNPSTARYMGNSAQFNIQDGSWFRLRTVSLSYAIPKAALAQSIFKGGVRFNFTGTNLFLNTPFRGYDPEALTFGSGTNIIGFVGRNNPATRSFQLGVNVNF